MTILHRRPVAVAIAALALLTLLLPGAALASEVQPERAAEAGNVQIPLEVYNQLLAAADQPTHAPASYALGRAEVNVSVNESGGRAGGEVRVTLSVEVLEDRWALVPILPAGTPVDSVTLAGKPVQLISTPAGLAWGVNQSGSYTLQLHYHVDAARSDAGFALTVPTPEAAATRLAASLPGANLDVAVIPAAATTSTSAGGRTQITATVPATSGVLMSWRAPSAQSHSISRAVYSGELAGDAIRFDAELRVELARSEAVTLELLPKSVTLNDIQVDGKKAPILVSGGRFATVVEGRGSHKLRLAFQVPVVRTDGPPRVALQIPEIPVSRFQLVLPGRKDVSVSPKVDVAHTTREKNTVASFHVPMTQQVQLSWTEAIPGDLRTDTRANANLYHAVHVEEGVLYTAALVDFKVTRGEVSSIELELPADVQISGIHADNGGISDWRVAPGTASRPQVATVFLGHGVTDELRFRVLYDRSLGKDELGEAGFVVPVMRARGVHRQRGMVALLSTREVALQPAGEKSVTRVGENQLPAFFRRTIERSVAHTYKYAEVEPRLVARTAVPDRALAKFDAEVNTLVSLTDVTLQGSASVNINVKSGKLSELGLRLPFDVNLLNLTAPSLRTHRAREGDPRLIDVEFTQDMEGQFRIEVSYERILTDSESEVSVPTLSVVGAEVEQGRIAVEALAAVEVQVASVDQLSTLDPSELPQQLVLKTTNPILLGYKYVHVDPPYALALRMTRHREVEVQDAAIDRADYRTLFTRDGMAVTTARFTVRNSRKQFLRVRLPYGSEVWSAAVDSKPEKPAAANGNGNGENGHAPEILIKVINSVEGFPVELIYATPVSEMGRFGRVGTHLPRPDMVVTRSRWDLYLPARYHYGTPRTDMDLVVEGATVTRDALEAQMASQVRNVTEPLQPFHIEVPASGIHYAFEKLYANQADEDAVFSIPYTSGIGAAFGQSLALLGTALFWGGLALAYRSSGPTRTRAALAAGAGLVLLLFPIGYLQTSPTPPLLLSLIALLGASALYVRSRRNALAT